MMFPQNKYRLAALALIACVCFQGQNAVALSLKELSNDKNSANRANKPTKIAADTMDIDFQNNLATLTGNVDVNDPSVRIKCDKMMVYLQEKEAVAGEEKKPEAKEESKGENKGGEENLATGGNKELKKIVCIGNVVITRRLYDKNDISMGEQRATAGKALFDVKENMIVLTEDNPTIMRGKDTLTGNKITLWLDSERLKVESGTGDAAQRAEVNVENIKALQQAPAEKTEDKK